MRNLIALLVVAIALSSGPASAQVTQWALGGQVLSPQTFPNSSLPGTVGSTGLVLPNGSIRLYFSGPGGVVSAVSSDGVNFTVESGTRLATGAGGYVGSPKVAATPDGRVRLYFDAGAGNGMGSAISSDGLNFVVEPSLRVTSSSVGESAYGLMGGSVVQLPNGTYRMYFSEDNIGAPVEHLYSVFSATSSDMLNWTVESGVRIGAGSGVFDTAHHPQAVVNADGSVSVYFTLLYTIVESRSLQGIWVATASDGVHFGTPVPTNLLCPPSVCGTPKSMLPGDPNPVVLPNGQLRLYYDHQDGTTGISSIWTATSNLHLDGASYAVIAPTFNGSDGNLSFVRLANTQTYSTNVSVTVVGSPSGTVYGTRDFTIPALASPQYSLQDILSATYAGSLANGDTTYSLYLNDAFAAVNYQHVIYNGTNGFFEKIGACRYVASGDYSGFNSKLYNVHTSQLGNYPAWISVHNFASTSATYNATVYDAATGTLIGTVPVAVGANATYFVPFSWYEQQLKWTPTSSQLHANIAFSATGSASYAAEVSQYIVNNTFSAYVNMTQRCALGSVAVAIPQVALDLLVIGGGGTVTSAPAGISCTGVCRQTEGLFNTGTTVVLTAAAATGSTFKGWGGVCSGVSATCSVVTNSAQTVTATFSTP